MIDYKGCLVKLTGNTDKNKDEVHIFRVTDQDGSGGSIQDTSGRDYSAVGAWDIEVLDRPVELPKGEFAVVGSTRGVSNPYVLVGGVWREVCSDRAYQVPETDVRVSLENYGFEVLFEGVSR